MATLFFLYRMWNAGTVPCSTFEKYTFWYGGFQDGMRAFKSVFIAREEV